MINVTKTFLPDLEEYIKTIKRAWDKAWITNNGELVQELESKLREYLGVKHLLYTSNGTIVLQMALKAYNITKEVITTPFSYVATTNAIIWEGCKPVFVDINSRNFCIDAAKIEAAITEDTQAILATHVYGYPCDIEKIESIAAKYNLKVIYDGAHAFGCRYMGKSLLSYGDISTCSFHATKLFHTVEGGCIITHDDVVANRLMLYRQFGHINDDYYTVGLNAKNSEFHAAMGLCVLPHIHEIIQARKDIVEFYDKKLACLKLQRPSEHGELLYNYSYYPVAFDSEETLIRTRKALEAEQINTRRYFYPSLNNLNYLSYQPAPVSEDLSKRVLCLPLFFDLSQDQADRIASIILRAQNK
ncbi:MAG: DegT/DnrJ/EryC1/StrS family aminotransferase [Chitinophagaceae bacterium]|nr:DegT/DnrJ/EryC1/StrS family aminotransferase [Chitinophagaceae bacterium]